MFFMTFPNLHSANPPSPTAFHKPHHANFRFESLQWSFRRVQQSGMGAFSMWCLCGFFFFGFSHSHEGWFFLNAFAYLGISCEPLPLSDWSTFPFFCFYCGRNTEDPSLKIFLEVVIAKSGRDEKEKLWHKQLGWKSGIEWGIGLEDQRLGSNCDLGRGEVPILAHFDLHRIVWWFFFLHSLIHLEWKTVNSGWVHQNILSLQSVAKFFQMVSVRLWSAWPKDIWFSLLPNIDVLC